VGSRVVPVVLIGRFSTYSGVGTFESLPVGVSEFDTAEISVWRGTMETGSSFVFKLEASLDRETWTTLASGDPGEDTEVLHNVSLDALPWLRAVVVLGQTGPFPVVMCWAVGQLIKRRA